LLFVPGPPRAAFVNDISAVTSKYAGTVPYVVYQ
jgi:hypothetical protein